MLQNFDKVVQKDGKTFLQDEVTISRRQYQLGELQAVLDDAVKFLEEGDFPKGTKDVYTILDEGRDGLLAVVWNRADREAERLKVRPYVAKTWREQEREDVTPEQWRQADTLKVRHDRAIDGLSIDRAADVANEDGRLVVDAVGVSKRIEDSCTIEITSEMRKDLDAILDLASKVEAIERRGVNALELVEKLVRETERPSDAELYRRIVFRRHPAGTVHNPGVDFIMNQVALNNNHLKQ